MAPDPRAPAETAQLVTKVVNLRKSGYDIYIGRPRQGASPAQNWGNPYAIAPGKSGATRADVLARQEEFLLTSPDPRAVWMRENLHQLRGRTLGCFCDPQACHGHTLAWHAEDLAPGEGLPLGGRRPRLFPPPSPPAPTRTLRP